MISFLHSSHWFTELQQKLEDQDGNLKKKLLTLSLFDESKRKHQTLPDFISSYKTYWNICKEKNLTKNYQVYLSHKESKDLFGYFMGLNIRLFGILRLPNYHLLYAPLHFLLYVFLQLTSFVHTIAIQSFGIGKYCMHCCNSRQIL